MTEVPETVFWLSVGNTPWRTVGPDEEEQICSFLTHEEAYAFLIWENPSPGSSLGINSVSLAHAITSAKASGTKLLVGIETVFDPEATVH